MMKFMSGPRQKVGWVGYRYIAEIIGGLVWSILCVNMSTVVTFEDSFCPGEQQFSG